MDEAVYVGGVPELKGLTAIVMPDETYHLPLKQRTLVAQFGAPFKHPVTGEKMDEGWHTFPVTDFRLTWRVRV